MAVQKALNKWREEELIKKISLEEFYYSANIFTKAHEDKKKTLVLGEFILMELMRLGITNKEEIMTIQNTFEVIDVEKNGEIDLKTLKKLDLIDTSKSINFFHLK